MVSRHIFYDFDNFKLIKTYFMAQYEVCFDKFHMQLKRICILYLLDRVSYKCQLGKVGGNVFKFFCISIDFSLNLFY